MSKTNIFQIFSFISSIYFYLQTADFFYQKMCTRTWPILISIEWIQPNDMEFGSFDFENSGVFNFLYEKHLYMLIAIILQGVYKSPRIFLKKLLFRCTSLRNGYYFCVRDSNVYTTCFPRSAPSVIIIGILKKD